MLQLFVLLYTTCILPYVLPFAPPTHLLSSLSLSDEAFEAIKDSGSLTILAPGSQVEYIDNGVPRCSLIENVISRTKVTCSDGVNLALDAITTVLHSPLSLKSSLANPLSAAEVEDGMESVWRAYRRRRGGDPSRLSKKQLALLSQDESDIIRNCYKRDDHMVTSDMVAVSLFDDRFAFLDAAAMLQSDTKTGGRYKRIPCYPISHLNETHLLVLNGGWACVDESIRATTEASKFAKAATSSSPPSSYLSESILRRLETLAMGDENLDVGDVGTRETLKKMNFPVTPSGAKEALIKLNRWTAVSSATPRIVPFDEATLVAAKTLQERIQNKQLPAPPPLPSFTIDSKKTAFRDDAVILRPRPKSKVINGNKWELLISIVDVSPIFELDALSSAASTRCMSRYDLPLGPLHLMPPTALMALSFGGDVTEVVSVAVYIDEKTGKLLDCSVERNSIKTKALTYEDCNDILKNGEGGVATALRIIEKIFISWSNQRIKNSESSRRRDSKLNAKTTGATQFDRSPAHRLVDTSLDLYSYVATKLMRDAKASVPRMPGSSASKGGRLATAPLRRYIDCMAQRQILSVLCNVDDIKVLSNEECREISEKSGKARNAIMESRKLWKREK